MRAKALFLSLAVLSTPAFAGHGDGATLELPRKNCDRHVVSLAKELNDVLKASSRGSGRAQSLRLNLVPGPNIMPQLIEFIKNDPNALKQAMTAQSQYVVPALVVKTERFDSLDEVNWNSIGTAYTRVGTYSPHTAGDITYAPRVRVESSVGTIFDVLNKLPQGTRVYRVTSAKVKRVEIPRALVTEADVIAWDQQIRNVSRPENPVYSGLRSYSMEISHPMFEKYARIIEGAGLKMQVDAGWIEETNFFVQPDGQVLLFSFLPPVGLNFEVSGTRAIALRRAIVAAIGERAPRHRWD